MLKLALQQAQTLLENADDSDQTAMDAMVKKINEALDGLQYRPADYTAVDEAIERVGSLNKADYKDFSTVEEAIAAVERGLDIRHQPDVDQMAQDILDAVNALEKITGGQPDISGNHGGEEADTGVVEQSGIYAGIALMAAVMLAVLKKRKDSAEN